MYGIKYGEYSKLAHQTPIINTAFFQISKEIQEQAIKDAQDQWNTEEVQDSLKRDCKIEQEIKEEDRKLETAKIILMHPGKIKVHTYV